MECHNEKHCLNTDKRFNSFFPQWGYDTQKFFPRFRNISVSCLPFWFYSIITKTENNKKNVKGFAFKYKSSHLTIKCLHLLIKHVGKQSLPLSVIILIIFHPWAHAYCQWASPNFKVKISVRLGIPVPDQLRVRFGLPLISCKGCWEKG